MVFLSIQQRLNSLPDVLQDDRLLGNRGIGNEIGYYIFDYEPCHEPIVQRHLPKLIQQIEGGVKPLKVCEVNLYQVMIDLLKSRNVLDKAFQMEKAKGSATLTKNIKPMMRPEVITEHMQSLITGVEDLIFITGVGASWPLLRSHTILNNLHPVVDKIPVVLFFPGAYDGHELRLFDELKDDNYYRAFPLIPRQERPL
ncbi:MAG: DUF1788 domain-containing protein [Cyanobacteria bacterium CAN_BIN43]|nr:DUF1788 domain-containing protein [Cyanobacteria bacterium CAN_BIN43]